MMQSFKEKILSYLRRPDDRIRFTRPLIITAVILSAMVGSLHADMDLNGLRVGIFEGTIFDEYVMKKYPDAIRLSYANYADLPLAANTDKIDVFLIDDLTAYKIIKDGGGLDVLSNVSDLDMDICTGFSKDNPELRNEFNQFLREIREDGTYEKISNRWLTGQADSSEMPAISEHSKGPLLKYAVNIVGLPFAAQSAEGLVGFDIELMKRFAWRRNYRLNVLVINFSALIPALISGKADIISAGIAKTPERSRYIDFSDPYSFQRMVIMGKKSMLTADGRFDRKTGVQQMETDDPGKTEGVAEQRSAFWSRLKKSFYSNVMQENRYKLILAGLKTTFTISIFSVLLGTVLGGGILWMRLNRSPFIHLPARALISVVRGTPILVILMITFYVIFASVRISPVAVSVFAFGLNFAAYVSEMYRAGIKGVDRGQREAGIALGFTSLQCFAYIVAPQAVRRILPVYKGEVISLVKMTSIVGYIAVQDLTKAGDIIRSRTFDAFFPLVMVAVLYFLISSSLMLVLNRVEIHLEPGRRGRR